MEGYTLREQPIAAPRGPSPLLRLAGDERLVALTRRGDQAAFEVLVARYQARLLAFCRRIVGSREDAEDVLQEVFAAAFNALHADERAINVRPWLYRIARNRSLNLLRRHTAIGVDSMDVHVADMGISTDDKVFRREELRVLVRDIGTLPETQRTALLAREIDGLSYEQVAQAMETTVPSVKSLLVRARVGLAEAAEARMLSCEDVRLELAAAAEGIAKPSAAVRRHLRECDQCRTFRGHLREGSRTLAALAPLGPVLLLHKLILGKLGLGASGAGASAGSGTIAAGGGAGVLGGSTGAFTATALATKAVAGIAAAALLTAGAVAVVPSHHHRAAAPAVIAAQAPIAAAPAVSGPHIPTWLIRRTHRAAPTPAPVITTAIAPTPAAAAPAVAPAPSTEEVTTTTVFPAGALTGATGASGASGSTGSAQSTATSAPASATTGASSPTGATTQTGSSGPTGVTALAGTGAVVNSGATGETGASGTTGATGSTTTPSP